VSGTTTAPFIATALDSSLNVITPTPAITWSITAGPGTAYIDPNTGTFTAYKVGAVTITATSATPVVTQTQTVTVIGNAALSYITITGAAGATSVTSGGTLACTAAAFDVYSNPIASVTFLWSLILTPNQGTGKIDPSGLLTGWRDGAITVVATSGNVVQQNLFSVTG